MKHYSLAFKDMNDKYVFLNSVDTQPLSRLHIHQAILSSKRHNTGFAWISFYSDKWKGQNRYKSIVACLATYDDSINENHIDEVLFEQTIP